MAVDAATLGHHDRCAHKSVFCESACVSKATAVYMSSHVIDLDVHILFLVTIISTYRELRDYLCPVSHARLVRTCLHVCNVEIGTEEDDLAVKDLEVKKRVDAKNVVDANLPSPLHDVLDVLGADDFDVLGDDLWDEPNYAACELG